MRERVQLIEGDGAEPMDQRLVCVECDEEFVFTVGEQDFYDARGLQRPKRCRQCRQLRRLAQ